MQCTVSLLFQNVAWLGVKLTQFRNTVTTHIRLLWTTKLHESNILAYLICQGWYITHKKLVSSLFGFATDRYTGLPAILGSARFTLFSL